MQVLSMTCVVWVLAGTPGDWTHILKQIGMFTFTGLNMAQVQFMTREFHIYMTSDGYVLVFWGSVILLKLLHIIGCMLPSVELVYPRGKLKVGYNYLFCAQTG
jgi:hypothetical protein